MNDNENYNNILFWSVKFMYIYIYDLIAYPFYNKIKLSKTNKVNI